MRHCHHLLSLLLLLLLTAAGIAAEPTIDIAFLTVEQARAAIVDESVEPYFSLLQPQEMSTKTGAAITGATLAEQRDVCRKRYQAAVGGFSAAEQAGLTGVVAAVQPFLVEHYPRFAAEPWRFIKLGSALEGGMPHTRGHCIVLSDAVMPMLLGGGKPGANPVGIMLLVHEQTHVVQRLHPELFAPLYTEAWGLVRMAKAPAPVDGLLAHQLVNPDGIACVWAFPVDTGGWDELVQPQVILGSDAEVPRMPQDFAVVALTVERRGDAYAYVLDEQGRPRSRPLAQVAAYIDAFAPSEENFHPNEICAELFSRQVVLDLLGRKTEETPCQQALRAWAATRLGSTAGAQAPLKRMTAPAPHPAVSH